MMISEYESFQYQFRSCFITKKSAPSRSETGVEFLKHVIVKTGDISVSSTSSNGNIFNFVHPCRAQ